MHLRAVRTLSSQIILLTATLAAAPALAQTPDPAQLKAIERDLKQSESESQQTSSDDSMNTLWAESQESQKPTDSAKKTKPKSKSKT